MTGVLEVGSSRYVDGSFIVSVPAALCVDVTHICVLYQGRTGGQPPIEDTDNSNDATCADVQSMLMCGDSKHLIHIIAAEVFFHRRKRKKRNISLMFLFLRFRL